ncbi:PRKCA-binding protein-like isoform X1 [Tigriopus californicus]|nr:PRKCA-binding protein-like isoform X1 [Tigriopus californicus]
MDFSHYMYMRENMYDASSWLPEDRRGMSVTSGVATIEKDDSNLIGISIGGGSPLCPCLYVVQVFDNTASSREGTLESGDEIVGVNGSIVKGKSKVEVAKMIQASKDQVTIRYNKLHADPKRGKTLDLILKKLKHQMVENMSTSTADALGLSRAILCNDSLVRKLEELERTEFMYKGLVDHTKRVLRGYFDLLMICKDFGDIFCTIGVREPQKTANEAFCEFGEYHRQMEKYGIKMLKATKPILQDLGTYITKAIPDTKLTIKRYADVKFEYLSYCLKVKEMDDEDVSYASLGEPLYRVETGNYEYRLVLRCRSDARKRFAKLRSDVLVKLELLDNKHVQDIVFQLRRLMSGLTTFHQECAHLMKDAKLFPIEVDLTRNAFQYQSTNQIIRDEENDLDNEGDEESERERRNQTQQPHIELAQEALMNENELGNSMNNLDLLSLQDSQAPFLLESNQNGEAADQSHPALTPTSSALLTTNESSWLSQTQQSVHQNRDLLDF